MPDYPLHRSTAPAALLALGFWYNFAWISGALRGFPGASLIWVLLLFGCTAAGMWAALCFAGWLLVHLGHTGKS